MVLFFGWGQGGAILVMVVYLVAMATGGEGREALITHVGDMEGGVNVVSWNKFPLSSAETPCHTLATHCHQSILPHMDKEGWVVEGPGISADLIAAATFCRMRHRTDSSVRANWETGGHCVFMGMCGRIWRVC